MWLSEEMRIDLHHAVANWFDDQIQTSGSRKIACIKYVRNVAECGMLAAKLYVERVWNHEIDASAQPDDMKPRQVIDPESVVTPSYTDVRGEVRASMNTFLRGMNKALAANLSDSDRRALVQIIRGDLQIMLNYLQLN